MTLLACGHLYIDPDEAESVKFAFSAFIKHGTLAATAKFLTASGIKMPKKVQGSGAIRESQFTVDSLYRLLRNKAYIGVRVFNTKQGAQEVPAVWEPIIWQEVKKFVLNDGFAKDLLERARAMKEIKNQSDELIKIHQKIKNIEGQIEILAERMAKLPKAMDINPLVNQLTKMQFEEAAKSYGKDKAKVDDPVHQTRWL